MARAAQSSTLCVALERLAKAWLDQAVAFSAGSFHVGEFAGRLQFLSSALPDGVIVTVMLVCWRSAEPQGSYTCESASKGGCWLATAFSVNTFHV